MIERKNSCDLSISTVTLTNGTNPHSKQEEPVIKVYRRRYWMLFLFSFLSVLCGMIFPQYVSIADVNICYYDISTSTLNWTANIFFIGYVVFVFPVSYCMNYVGLRWTVIAGALSNTAACAIQFTGLSPENFAYILVSTIFGSMSNLLVLSVPPFLAATWFPANELSRACAAGVFGNQLGVAAGCLFSPLMTSNNCSDKALIQEEKTTITTILTSVNVFWLFLVVFTFQDSPKYPPNLHQVKKQVTHSHLKTVIGMFKSLNFIMLFVIYGLMVGTCFAITTVLNNLVLRYFPHRELEIGWMGSLFIVAGLIGSMIAGTILDYTHKFK
ncbi:uncharacterized MFS-type transporter C09D4.1-like [Parasteatoda tepidariorum]|uniref:uncharacterized MFS-type transporter C09D4.1-like n=1 Tax=Parasteatoda tepidariorum TaxID=114398 RepID=UPI0039BD4CD8